MLFSNKLVAYAAASLATAQATLQGFNYGSTKTDGSAMLKADYVAQFTAAQKLPGTSGWTAARLYTTIVSPL